jgi:hypothetical protein
VKFDLATGGLRVQVRGPALVFEYSGIVSVSTVLEACEKIGRTTLEPAGRPVVVRLDRCLWTSLADPTHADLAKSAQTFRGWPVALVVGPEAVAWWRAYAIAHATRVGGLYGVFTEYAAAVSWALERAQVAMEQEAWELARVAQSASSRRTPSAAAPDREWRLAPAQRQVPAGCIALPVVRARQ